MNKLILYIALALDALYAIVFCGTLAFQNQIKTIYMSNAADFIALYPAGELVMGLLLFAVIAVFGILLLVCKNSDGKEMASLIVLTVFFVLYPFVARGISTVANIKYATFGGAVVLANYGVLHSILSGISQIAMVALLFVIIYSAGMVGYRRRSQV